MMERANRLSFLLSTSHTSVLSIRRRPEGKKLGRWDTTRKYPLWKNQRDVIWWRRADEKTGDVERKLCEKIRLRLLIEEGKSRVFWEKLRTSLFSSFYNPFEFKQIKEVGNKVCSAFDVLCSFSVLKHTLLFVG
jgi:hypothetical protein